MSYTLLLYDAYPTLEGEQASFVLVFLNQKRN